MGVQCIQTFCITYKMMSKSSLFIISLTSIGVKSDLKSIGRDIQQLAARTGDRSLVGVNAVVDFDGYGCWCYFEEAVIENGKGEPVNEYDAACKAMHGGYECAVAD